jgi:hypothetical protein
MGGYQKLLTGGTMSRTWVVFFSGLLAALFLCCGPNEATDPSLSKIGPPQNLKSVSLDKSRVGLKWDAPTGATDSTFAGYAVSYGAHSDTLGKASVVYAADSLPAGETAFEVQVRTRDGHAGEGVTIRWAPAERFASGIVLTEFTPLESTRLAGLRVGGKTTGPAAVAVNPAAVDNFDLYLYGGGSAPAAQPLSLWSASLYSGSTYRKTYFSTVQYSSSTLDYYISAFPDQGTFTQTMVDLTDNMIYFAKIIGDVPSETHFVRILVQGIGGSFPARTARITLSLQRVPGLMYASAEVGAEGLRAKLEGATIDRDGS